MSVLRLEHHAAPERHVEPDYNRGLTRRRIVRWRLQPNTPTGNFIEDIFAPMDEEAFNEGVTNPAGGREKQP